MGVWGVGSPFGITSWSGAAGAVVSLPGTISTDGIAALEAKLGVDIMFDGDYHLSADRDYVLVRGLAALTQWILHCLLTKPGEFTVRPGYGVGLLSFVKKRKTPSALDEIKQRIIDQLSLDDRIDEVVEIVIEDLPEPDPGIKLLLRVRAVDTVLRFRPLIITERTVQGALP